MADHVNAGRQADVDRRRAAAARARRGDDFTLDSRRRIEDTIADTEIEARENRRRRRRSDAAGGGILEGAKRLARAIVLPREIVTHRRTRMPFVSIAPR